MNAEAPLRLQLHYKSRSYNLSRRLKLIMGGEFDYSVDHHGTVSVEPTPAEMGSETELVKIRGAQLCLIDGEESVLTQKGDFWLRLLKQEHSPLAVIVAAVGEVQWPVGKDAPVLKVWNRRYTFALPGLVYGLIFPAETPAEVLQHLEAVMDHYCTFQVHREIAIAAAQQQVSTGAGERDVAEYWTAVAAGVETTSAKVARQICSTSSTVADSILIGGEWATLGVKQGGSFVKRNVRASAGGERGMTPRMLKRTQQARRMSAVAKVMSRSLLKGAISATGHVASSLGLDVNAPASLYDSMSDDQSGAKDVAVASVDAFAKLVEAVETAGKSVYGMTSAVGTDLVQHRFGNDAGKLVQDSLGAVGNVIDTAWTLNKMGLKMLLQVTAASTAISTRKRTSATRSYTDEQQLEPSSSASPCTNSTKSPQPTSSLLFHQITLSPQQHQQLEHHEQAEAANVPLNLLPAASQNSDLKPMRTQTFFGPTPPAAPKSGAAAATLSPSRAGNYTSPLNPVPFGHPKSPFRHYSRHSQPHQSSPNNNFSFHLDQSKGP